MATSILAVKISKSLAMGKSVRDAIPSAWDINLNNAKKVNTIVAVHDKKVVGVFSVGDPSLISGPVNHGRVEFKKVSEIDSSQFAHYQSLDPYIFRGPVKYI